jgi:anti-sigma B factor antagonist
MSSERGSVEPQPAEDDFQIKQRQDPGGYLRLILVGELDLSGVPKLTAALSQLKMESERVRLDLSQLEFLDSTGVSAIVVGLRNARNDGWHLEIDRRLSPQVERIIDVSGVGPFLWPSNGD